MRWCDDWDDKPTPIYKIAGAIVGVLIIIGMTLGPISKEKKETNNAAVALVQHRYVPNEAFFQLNPDLQSGSWRAYRDIPGCTNSGKDASCWVVKYDVTVLQYSGNTKEIECEWLVSGDTTDTSNMEASMLFSRYQ